MTIDLGQFTVSRDSTLGEALEALDRSGQGVALVVEGDRLDGVVTDGDLRRAMLAGHGLDEACLSEVMSTDFVSVDPDAGRAVVLDLMRAHRVRNIPIVDEQRRVVGIHGLHTVIGSQERPNWAVILAGGQGTRLRPLTEYIPKPMIKVAGRPILERLVLHLVGFGVRRIFLSVNYMADVVKEYFEDGAEFGASITYLEEDEPLGTGGPLSLLPEPPSDPVLLLNGDLVTEFDVGRMLDTHAQSGCRATVGVRPHQVDVPFGVADVVAGRLMALEEKPTLQMLVNAGIYVFEPEVVADIPRRRYPITSLISTMIDSEDPVGTYVIEGDWTDVGRPADLSKARGDQ